MANFGTAFENAIRTTGLAGLPFSWDSEGNIYGLENLTSAQQTALTNLVTTYSNMSGSTAVNPLIAAASTFQQQIASGGIKVNVGTTQSPINVEASTDAASLVLLQGAYTMAAANSGASFNWVQSAGTSVTLTSAQVITIFNAVTTFLQSTFTTLSAVIAAINSSSVTTIEQVYSFSNPAWPSNS